MVVCSHCGGKRNSQGWWGGVGQDGWGGGGQGEPQVPGSDSSECSQYSWGPWIESMLFGRRGKGWGLRAESVVCKTHSQRSRRSERASEAVPCCIPANPRPRKELMITVPSLPMSHIWRVAIHKLIYSVPPSYEDNAIIACILWMKKKMKTQRDKVTWHRANK